MGQRRTAFSFSQHRERVANISIEELREQKFSQRKAEYIVGLAKHIVGGKLDLARIQNTERSIGTIVTNKGYWSMDSAKLFNVWAWSEKYVSKSRHWNSARSARCISI